MNDLKAYKEYITINDIDLTVFVITYNRAELLSNAIDSILSQSYRRFALVVVDNASTDNTYEIVNRYQDERVFYYCQDVNVGGIGNINTSIDLAATKYIVIFHDDDAMEKELLSSEYKVIQANSYQCVSCRAEFYDSENKKIAIKDHFGDHNKTFTGTKYMEHVMSGGESVIFPTAMYDAVFLHKHDIHMDPSAGPCGDLYFLSEICLDGGTLCIISEKHIQRILHSGQDSVRSEFWMNIQVLNYFVQDERYSQAVKNNESHILDGYLKNVPHLLANYYEKKVDASKLEFILGGIDVSKFNTSFKKKKLIILLWCSSHIRSATSFILWGIRSIIRVFKYGVRS